MAETLLIRPAALEDAEKVYHLSNDPVVRACSIQNRPIAWDSHLRWFREALANTNLHFFIIESESGEFVAQVRFLKEEGGWITSISIHADFRGKKLGERILKLAMAQMPGEALLAWVKVTNTPSLRLFEKAGYSYSGTDVIGEEMYRIYRYEP